MTRIGPCSSTLIGLCYKIRSDCAQTNIFWYRRSLLIFKCTTPLPKYFNSALVHRPRLLLVSLSSRPRAKVCNASFDLLSSLVCLVVARLYYFFWLSFLVFVLAFLPWLVSSFFSSLAIIKVSGEASQASKCPNSRNLAPKSCFVVAVTFSGSEERYPRCRRRPHHRHCCRGCWCRQEQPHPHRHRLSFVFLFIGKQQKNRLEWVPDYTLAQQVDRRLRSALALPRHILCCCVKLSKVNRKVVRIVL